jgi:phosphoserine phosphatase
MSGSVPRFPSENPQSINPNADEFVASVLSLRPKIAIFDCDGTLWANNAGEDFFYWSLGDKNGKRIVSEKTVNWARARYDEYLAGKVDEEVMCGEMTTMYEGLSISVLESAAKRFFSENVARNYFAEMRELVTKLAVQGCELWAVSSSNEWVIRAGLRDLSIPPSHILAAQVEINSGIASNSLIRVPTGPTKATAIREMITGPVDMVFGNSVHDTAMLELAVHAFAVNPNPDLEELAQSRGWTVYWPRAVKAEGSAQRLT